MKKLFVLAPLLGAMGVAHASYDLVLVADETTASVHRFDGNSGAYLGQFGKSRLAVPQGLAVNAATGLAYVASFGTSTIQVYNYNTGVFMNEFALGLAPRCMSWIGSDLLISGTGGLRRYTTSGSLVTTYSNDDLIMGCTVGSDGFVYTYNYTLGQFQRYSAAGTLVGSTANSTDFAGYPRYGVLKYGSQNIWTNYSTHKIEFQSTPAMTMSSSFSISSLINNPIGLAPGHSSALYVSGYSTASGSPGVIAQVSALTGRVGLTFGNGILIQPRGMASVVAPEPSTWFALGLGVLALARRRKRN